MMPHVTARCPRCGVDIASGSCPKCGWAANAPTAPAPAVTAATVTAATAPPAHRPPPAPAVSRSTVARSTLTPGPGARIAHTPQESHGGQGSGSVPQAGPGTTAYRRHRQRTAALVAAGFLGVVVLLLMVWLGHRVFTRDPSRPAVPIPTPTALAEIHDGPVVTC